MVVGIVLAAGMSSRMGQLKQLMPLGKRRVLEWVVEVVGRQLDQVVVVLGHRAGEITPVLAPYPVRCVVNPDYRSGMLSSVKCGGREVGEGADYLICLGDQPRIGERVVHQVLNAAKETDAGIVIPTYEGKRGHPILVRNVYRTPILALSLELGLNAVIRKNTEDILEVPVSEAVILEDMDTPADYQRELDKWPQN